MAGDNVGLRQPLWRARALRPHQPARPRPGCLRPPAPGSTMFSRKKRELMKTPSISKKNRAGSPSPQPLGVSEPLLGLQSGRDLREAPRRQGPRARGLNAGPAAGGSHELQPLPGWTAQATQDRPGPWRSAHGRSPLGCPPHPCASGLAVGPREEVGGGWGGGGPGSGTTGRRLGSPGQRRVLRGELERGPGAKVSRQLGRRQAPWVEDPGGISGVWRATRLGAPYKARGASAEHGGHRTLRHTGIHTGVFSRDSECLRQPGGG